MNERGDDRLAPESGEDRAPKAPEWPWLEHLRVPPANPGPDGAEVGDPPEGGYPYTEVAIP